MFCSDANIIGNDALAPVAQKNLEEVGGFTISDTEKAFARGVAEDPEHRYRSEP